MRPDRFPGIKQAALAITYDNGGVFAGRSEKQMLRELGRWLDKQPEEIIQPVDTWLSALSEEEMEIACCGEDDERERLLASAPPFTDDLLNAYFNEVC